MVPPDWLSAVSGSLLREPAGMMPLMAQVQDFPLVVASLTLAVITVILGFQLYRYRGMIATENEVLRANAAQSRLLEDLSPVMPAIISPEGDWVKVAGRMCELLGYTEDQLVGHSVREVTEPDDYAEECEEFRALIAGVTSTFRLQKRFVRADGLNAWCSMNASLVYDKSGRIDGVLAYFIDITEAKRAEEHLRRSEELNRLILEAGPGGYLLLSADRKFQRANEEALHWMGLTIEQLRKMAVDDFQGKTFYEDGSPCPPDDYPAVKCFATQEKASPQTIGFQRQDGSMVWAVFSAAPLRDPVSGEFAGVVATFVDLTERKRAEEELAQAMEFLEGVIHKAPAVAIQVFDETGKVELWNPASERLYGYAAKEILGHRIQEVLLREEDTPAFEQMVERLVTQKRSIEPYEWQIQHRNGEQRHVMSSMFALPRSRDAIRICCIDLDITARKSMEEELRRSEERYRAFILASSEAIWRFECAGPVSVEWPLDRQVDAILSCAILEECNDAMARMYGYERAKEIVGKCLKELLDADPRNRGFLQAFIESGYRLAEAESIEVDRHGNRKTVLNTLIGTVKNGHLIRCWGTQRDITARRAAEEGLRRSEALLRQVLDALPVGVWVADRCGSLILGNPAGREIWGVRELGDFAWTRARGWWHQNGREIGEQEWALSRALSHGETSLKEEIDIECLDGSRKTISTSAVPIRNETSEIIGAIVVNEDITDRMRLEAQLRHSQKMESIGQLAAGVAHDFNNILTIIRGHLDLLLRRRQLPDEAKQSLEQAADAADRAANLTRQLLLFSNRQLIQPRLLDLNAVVEDAIRLLRRTLGENIHLDLRCRPALPNLYTDAGMIEQIVANLALNARDAMPAGGRLSIRTDLVDFTEADAEANSAARPGRFLSLEVRDTGIGMDKETMSRIFEPFFTTKGLGRGTGLGLATVYGIVQRHEGWIDAESEPGQGTSFRIYFPVDAGVQEQASLLFVPPETPVMKGGSETILLVEDEEPLLDLVKGILTEYGYRVLTASNGVAAIGVWEQHWEGVDLLLTDMMMPHGLSGRDIAKRFVAQKPCLGVIYSSGYSVELFGDTFETTDRCRFLEKPYTPGELCQMVREVLDSAPSKQPPPG